MHGLLDSCRSWLFNGANESLPYLLADAGFDVYLPNNRGNLFNHKVPRVDGVSPKKKEYWQFSFHTMATYDVPAFVDFALNVSGAPQVGWVGHSEGTMQMFAALADDADHTLAAKLYAYSGLGPLIYLKHMEQKLLKRLADLDADKLIATFGDKQFLPHIPLIAKLGVPFCSDSPNSCKELINYLCGDAPFSQINSSSIAIMPCYEPGGTSVQNLEAFGQAVRKNRHGKEEYWKFDYGYEGNKRHYGHHHTPSYNMSNYPTTVPTYLFSGTQDILADPADVASLIEVLPVANVQHREIRDYAHLSFLWDWNAKNVFYDELIDFLTKYSI